MTTEADGSAIEIPLDVDGNDEADAELDRKSLIEITDPATLDLLLIFGEPFVLDPSFWRKASVAILEGPRIILHVRGTRASPLTCSANICV